MDITSCNDLLSFKLNTWQIKLYIPLATFACLLDQALKIVTLSSKLLNIHNETVVSDISDTRFDNMLTNKYILVFAYITSAALFYDFQLCYQIFALLSSLDTKDYV